ncbi:hypothetical protein JCM8097_008508 [Rhodosporidiobolus ruineniae]
MSEHFVDPVELKEKEGRDVTTLHPGGNNDSWQGGDSLRAAGGKQQQGPSTGGHSAEYDESLPHFSDRRQGVSKDDPSAAPEAGDKLNELDSSGSRGGIMGP